MRMRGMAPESMAWNEAMDMNDIYEMRLSDRQWWICDVPGNIGWILWVVCTVVGWTKGLTVFSLLSVLPALLMLIGVAELVSERITGLGRTLPRVRVLRGFGALTAGGILGIPLAAGGWMAQVGSLALWMLAGAVLCAAFAGICWRGYQRRQTDGRKDSRRGQK